MMPNGETFLLQWVLCAWQYAAVGVALLFGPNHPEFWCFPECPSGNKQKALLEMSGVKGQGLHVIVTCGLNCKKRHDEYHYILARVHDDFETGRLTVCWMQVKIFKHSGS